MLELSLKFRREGKWQTSWMNIKTFYEQKYRRTMDNARETINNIAPEHVSVHGIFLIQNFLCQKRLFVVQMANICQDVDDILRELCSVEDFINEIKRHLGCTDFTQIASFCEELRVFRKQFDFGPVSRGTPRTDPFLHFFR